MRIVDAIKSEVKGMPSDDDFDFSKFLLEDWSGTSKKLPMTKESIFIRASGIYDFCPREQTLLSKAGIMITETGTPRDELVMGLGTLLHYWFQNRIFKKRIMGAWRCRDCKTELGNVHEHYYHPGKCPNCKSEDLEFLEVLFSDVDLCLHGHTDGFVYLNKKKTVLDFKSAKHEAFMALKSFGVSQRYVWQQQAYMYLTGTDQAILLYFDKNESDFSMVVLKRDGRIVGEIKRKCNDTIKAIYSIAPGKDTWLPQRLACDTKSCTRAKNCAMKNQCFTLPESEGFVNIK